MAGLFSSSVPTPPQEDPSVAAERAAQAKRANDDRIAATQKQLQQETLASNNNFGTRSLLGQFGTGTIRKTLGVG